MKDQENLLAEVLRGKAEKLGLPRGEDGRLLIKGGWVCHESGRSRPASVGPFSFTVAANPKRPYTGNVKSVRFLRCRFENVLLEDMVFQDCVFERCAFPNASIFTSRFENCSFPGCTFRETGMGGGGLGRHVYNEFISCSFDGADLRQSFHGSEKYAGCTFIHTRLHKANFWAARFIDCVFESELVETEFYANMESHPDSIVDPNRLAGCDFRKCRILNAMFVGINLDPGMLPQDDPDLIVLRHGPADLMNWKSYLDATGSKAVRSGWLLGYLAGTMGAPSLINRSYLLGADFSDEEISALQAIAAAR